MQAGVKTALDEKKKTVVESLAKGIVSKIKPQGLPTDKSKGDQPSSSSTSSQSSLKQKTILQMYAQAARRIPQNSKNKPVPAAHPVSQRKSASQGSAGDFPPPPPPPRRITQSQPPPGQITQSQPPPEPHQIAQSQPAPGQSQPVKRSDSATLCCSCSPGSSSRSYKRANSVMYFLQVYNPQERVFK